VPAWLDDALVQLITPSPVQEIQLAQLARQADALIPLRTLFDSTESLRPAGAPRPVSGGAPAAGDRRAARSGGDRALDRATLFSAQALAVARFLTEREGPEFVGHLADGLLAGARVADVLRDARNVPTDLVAFENAWRTWLAEQGA
jgi:hypothetical protein